MRLEEAGPQTPRLGQAGQLPPGPTAPPGPTTTTAMWVSRVPYPNITTGCGWPRRRRGRSSDPPAGTGEAALQGPDPTASTVGTRPGVVLPTTSPPQDTGMSTGTGSCTPGRTVGPEQVLDSLPGKQAIILLSTPTEGTSGLRAPTGQSGRRRRAGSGSRGGRRI